MKKRLTISILSLIIFGLMIFIVTSIDVKAIGPEGTSIGLATINGLIHEKIGYNEICYKVSDILGYLAISICVIFGFVGLTQLIKRKSLFKVDIEIILLGVFYIVVICLKLLFDNVAINYRPIIMPDELHVEASFPSSHTMLGMCVYLTAISLLPKYLKKRTANILNTLLIILTVVFVGTRFISGVHWFSDIVASIVLSTALINLYLLSIKK